VDFILLENINGRVCKKSINIKTLDTADRYDYGS